MDPSKTVKYGKSSERVELHHLYPRQWVKDNIQNETQKEWANSKFGMVESIANLTPMIQSSNLKWRAKVPGKALADAGVTPATHATALKSHYLEQAAYEQLISGFTGLPAFWGERAKALATDIHSRMMVQG
ncbi:MAG: hypothetical protein ACXW3D_04620 [Caulobacteraceae bacterium]